MDEKEKDDDDDDDDDDETGRKSCRVRRAVGTRKRCCSTIRTRRKSEKRDDSGLAEAERETGERGSEM